MAPLIVLLATFGIVAVVRATLAPPWLDFGLCGRIAMSAMLLLTGPSHFFMTDEMVQMLPSWVPERVTIVYVTGVLEILAAAGLLVPATATLTTWCLVAFFVAVLPANIHAALTRAGIGGHGPAYLWFRVPLQAVFIAWVLWFRPSRSSGEPV